ncbi:hypothetical protein KJ953_00245 [Patescibacteria group bacterium]|nr:hypothetical protein [Patescibacteria group bacterium]MBU1256358.1 hypothetical protein [Patescibacteria group bacterium]MBU1457735.1 hypothetical protein [Patescibacteria group bacterium]
MVKKFSIILVILTLLFSSLIRTIEVSNNNFAFTSDQARDMLDIRHMVVSKIPKIVGPTTSINGVFLGPFWYYFNLPAFIIGHGNPATLVYWNIFCYQLTGFLIWLYFKKKNQTLAVVTSILFLLMPTGFSVTRYVWNANPMPMFTALFLLLVFDIIYKPSKIKKISLGIISGLFLQVEAAFAIIFLPFSLILLSKQKHKLNNIKHFLFGFLPTLIPQVIFELRHNFIMTKTFFNEFTGSSDMLGNNLSLITKITDRFLNFKNQLSGTLYLGTNLVLLLFVLAILFFIYQSKTNLKNTNKQANQLFLISFYFLITSALFYLIFPNKLKHWYLFGLSTPFVFIFASLFAQISKLKNKLPAILLIVLFSISLVNLIQQHTQIIKNEVFVKSTNPSNFANRLENIDIIYNSESYLIE